MRNILLLIFSVTVCLPASGEGLGTSLYWPGWSIDSPEDRWSASTSTNYPLSHLVDGNKNTAWIPAGKTKSNKIRTSPGFSIYSHKFVVIDGIWFMNGYNRRPDLFRRNNRVVQVRISVNGIRKIVNLSDKMGWHKISIPRQRTHSVSIEMMGIRKGQDNDTCISEVALYNRGKVINMHIPKAFILAIGGEGGGASYLISRRGKLIAQSALEVASWSSNGRYVCSIGDSPKRKSPRLWVADTVRGRIIWQTPVPTSAIENLRWKDNETIELTFRTSTFREGDKIPRRTFNVLGR